MRGRTPLATSKPTGGRRLGKTPSFLRSGSWTICCRTVAEQFEITDEMRSVVGTQSPPWTYEVTTTSIRAFARGVGYTDPVYFDEEAAKAAGYRSLPAPPGYVGTPVFMPGVSHPVFSAPAEGLPQVKHGLPGLLDGGTETEYLDTVCAGDTLTAVTKIAGLEVRESASLGKMLLVTTESTYSDHEGRPVIVQRGQVIYY